MDLYVFFFLLNENRQCNKTMGTKRKHTGNDFPEIAQKIRSGDYTARSPKDKKYSSNVTWSLIQLIFDEQHNRLIDFFYCSKCHAVFNLNLWDSGQCLTRHVNICSAASPSVSDYFVPEYHPEKRRKFKEDDKLLVREAALAFVIKDMRPINSLSGEGIASLLSRMTYIGSKYGFISEEDMLKTKLIPSRQTVSIALMCYIISIVHSTLLIDIINLFLLTDHPSNHCSFSKRSRAD